MVQAIARLESPVLRIAHVAINRPPSRYWGTPLSIAAIIALVIVPTMLLTSDHGRIGLSVDHPRVEKVLATKPPPRNTRLAVYATAHDVNSRVQNVVQTAMAQEQFAGLDHDFRVATQYLVNQVPLRSAWESAGARSRAITSRL